MHKKNSRVREIRKGLGLTQSQFAHKLGVSEGYIGQVEGGREPSDTLMQLIEIYATRKNNSPMLRENSTQYAAGDHTLKETIAEQAAALPGLNDQQTLFALGGIEQLIDLLKTKLKNKLENK